MVVPTLEHLAHRSGDDFGQLAGVAPLVDYGAAELSCAVLLWWWLFLLVVPASYRQQLEAELPPS
jgi:hypothetical protein